MEAIIKSIHSFHDTFGIKVSEIFGKVSPERDALHYDLLIEEVEEFREACMNNNEEKIIDGLGDVIFVAISSAIERGYEPILKEVLMEICRANISKGTKNGDNVFRADGKVLRSKSYIPPDIAGIIKTMKDNSNK